MEIGNDFFGGNWIRGTQIGDSGCDLVAVRLKICLKNDLRHKGHERLKFLDDDLSYMIPFGFCETIYTYIFKNSFKIVRV